MRIGGGPLGVAIALDGNGRYAALDPYTGAQLSLAEAARNVAVTGAEPVAVTNCMNFGSPEDPTVMWQFAEAVRGLADGCRALGIPVTGGNVSFYNQTGTTPINPTPVVGVLGIHPDVTQRTPMGFARTGDAIVLLGETREELSGSEWSWVTHRHLGGMPPVVDWAAERALHAVLAAGDLTSAHDLSTGGLAAALAECCLRGGLGAVVDLPGDPFVALMSESGGRALVSLPAAGLADLEKRCGTAGLAMAHLGTVGGAALTITATDPIGLAELRSAHEATMPALFGPARGGP